MTEIKVGSKWVSYTDNKLTILAIDGDYLFVKYDSGENGLVSEKDLKSFYKPSPVRRTVWLNVYDYGTHAYPTKEDADNLAREDILWQQEVELIDPRGGACGK